MPLVTYSSERRMSDNISPAWVLMPNRTCCNPAQAKVVVQPCRKSQRGSITRANKTMGTDTLQNFSVSARAVTPTLGKTLLRILMLEHRVTIYDVRSVSLPTCWAGLRYSLQISLLVDDIARYHVLLYLRLARISRPPCNFILYALQWVGPFLGQISLGCCLSGQKRKEGSSGGFGQKARTTKTVIAVWKETEKANVKWHTCLACSPYSRMQAVVLYTNSIYNVLRITRVVRCSRLYAGHSLGRRCQNTSLQSSLRSI